MYSEGIRLFDFDLFVIGAGSGGVRASRMAAATGAKVAIAEEYRYGGTCVIRGCVPKKLFSYASHIPEEAALGEGYGFDIEVKSFSWSKLMANKNAEIDRLEGIYDRLLTNAGVQSIFGRAVVTGPNQVEVAGKTYTAERILIATGGHPTKPNLPGAEFGVTSNEVFELKDLPKRIAVYGGGYIAVEFAGIFNGLGAETRLIYRGDKVLRGFDEDVRDFLTEQMRQKGMILQLETEIKSVTKNEDGSLSLRLNNGTVEVVDMLLFATGRGANTAGLGLEEAGVELDRRGAVKVNDQFQTSVPSIYALGDVIDRVQLTPVAIGEA
ncbi:MAG: FAD-dependent oxidoreductase, partial [Alphaproteobacteria bacterium]